MILLRCDPTENDYWCAAHNSRVDLDNLVVGYPIELNPNACIPLWGLLRDLQKAMSAVKQITRKEP